jgi:hypothetical protein
MRTVRYVGAESEPSSDQVMADAVRLGKEIRKEMAQERRARRR